MKQEGKKRKTGTDCLSYFHLLNDSCAKNKTRLHHTNLSNLPTLVMFVFIMITIPLKLNYSTLIRLHDIP